LGIVSGSYQQAVTLVNSMHGIAGCIAIEENKWEVQLLLLLHQLDKKEIVANRALLLNQNGVNRIIPYDVIDYIETVKGQHYCMVNYNRKQVKIRGSIRELRVVLDDNFVRVKSSVIVNVSNIEVLYRREHMILFRNGECCYFSKGFEKSLMNQIGMHTIHV
jgi:DNA-binding LytR/AlgR family response regulator